MVPGADTVEELLLLFVDVDEEMQPTEVPDLTVETERGENLRAAAQDSREEY
ncbi:hypothetical protein GCM10028857_23530 [Salinarchaeum chitinilyticum]